MISQEKIAFKKRCQKILDRIRKDFPKLRNEKINLKIKKLRKGSMKASKNLFGGYTLTIDPHKYAKANDKQIAGPIPHELIHFEDEMEMNLFTYILFYKIWYNLSKKFMKKIEHKTDKETINRGFARQLYANRLFRWKNLTEKETRNLKSMYLGPEQIKAYAKKIGKW